EPHGDRRGFDGNWCRDARSSRLPNPIGSQIL
ncbi:uncharacterized protein METZ01_LOCUS147119, partial [marine metagenome]